MKYLKKGLMLAVFLGVVAAIALLPVATTPSGLPIKTRTSAEIVYAPAMHVIVQGDCVSNPGAYTLPFGSTYRELFCVAGVVDPPSKIDAEAKIAYDDVVLIDGTYYIYLVL